MSSYLIVAVVALGFLTSLYLIRLWITGSKVSDSAVSQWLKSVQLSLDSSTRMMADVQHQLGEMSEVGRGIRSLQEFLQSPKLRGGIGEQILGEMIGETFPKNAFHLQYSFRSGVKVDAVLKTDAGLLCIDSKFPISNFTGLIKNDPGARSMFISDVKKHITDIAQKYILPDEGTMDFALMYIPSESVYYEVVNLPELTKIARDARVYPVSPNTLYAHLQVLLTSFQGKELEAKSREVFKILRGLQKDYDRMGEGLGTLNRHLTNAFNQMSNVNSTFTVFGQKLHHTDRLSLPDDTQ